MNLDGGVLPLLLCQMMAAVTAAAPDAAHPRLALVVDGDADVPPKLVADARARLGAAFDEVTSALVPADTVDKWVSDARARASSSCRGGLVTRDCRVSLGYVLEATYLAHARLTRAGARCILTLRAFELTRDQPVASYAGQGTCDAAGLMKLARKAVRRVAPALRLPRGHVEKRGAAAPPTASPGRSEPAEEPDDDEAPPDSGQPEPPPMDLEPGGALPPEG